METNTPVLHHTLNIGVTGHRHLPPASSARIEKMTSTILQIIKSTAVETRQSSAYANFMQHFDHGENIKLQIISSLAEGADRLVAYEGKRQGYKLLVPLPFSQIEYEKTFAPDDMELTNFRSLLSQADNVLEIDASNSNSSQAYADASRLMLAHSDLLLAFWNGQKTKYIAGTYATMQAAYKAGVPIIYIPSHDATETQNPTFQGIDANCVAVITEDATKQFDILNPDGQGLSLFATFIREYIVSTLLPEHSNNINNELSLQHQYEFFSENLYTKPSWLAKLTFYKEFLKTSKSSTRPTNKSLTTDSSNVWGTFKKTFSNKSGNYALEYKSRLMWRNLLPVLALIFLVCAINVDAMFETPDRCTKSGFYTAQVTCWFLFWFLVTRERTKRHTYLHHRTYRHIAEYCRISSYLWTVGYVHSNRSSHIKKHSQSFTNWYCRLLTRNIEFPAQYLKVDINAIKEWLQWVKNDFLATQLKYHRNRHDKNALLSKNLNLVAQFLYWIGMAAVISRGIAHWLVDEHYIDNIINLIVIAIAFTIPSIGAFFSTYSNCSGYGPESGTSADMHSQLQILYNECDTLYQKIVAENTLDNVSQVMLYRNAQLIDSNVCYTHVYELCERIDEIMNNEVTEWSSSSYSNLEKYM